MRRLFSLLLSLVLLLSVSWLPPQPARAAIRQQEEAPGQVLYQSRHTLRDGRGDSWQVILFKRVKDGQVRRIDLRLVGFPDRAAFSHPQPLTVAVPGGPSWLAPDQFATKSPAANVGQYDFTDILPQLSGAPSIRLDLPLAGEVSLSLSVPLPVVLEWQAIAQS